MEPWFIILILGGALCAGFVTGLTGFGTALVLSASWLHFMDPVTVAPLAAVCSAAAQLACVYGMWRSFQWRMLMPYLVGALIGVPIGVWLLDVIDPGIIKIGVGVFLVLYTSYSLFVKNPPTVNVDSKLADTVAGGGGGVLAGLGGFSGPIPLVWTQLRGLPKLLARGIYQPYNLVVLAGSAAVHTMVGNVTPQIGTMFLIALPASTLGAIIGLCAFHRISEKRFKQVVLTLLFCSGVLLLVRQIF